MNKMDTSKIAQKIDTSRIADKIAIRILRKWRNFDAGAIIRPPGSARQILLEAKDEQGKPVAEIIQQGEAETAAVDESPKVRRKKS